jgi:hypothetical protein
MLGSIILSRFSSLWLATAAIVSCNASYRNGKPNFVFIITDDQDLHLGSLDYMPLVKKHLGKQGTFYKQHYCTISICCPSRVSLLTGKAAHNTNVTDVSPPYGKCLYIACIDLRLVSNVSRRLYQVHFARPERQISPGVVARGRIRHLLHWQAHERSFDFDLE